jgi:PAS domain S-box-containing protein
VAALLAVLCTTPLLAFLAAGFILQWVFSDRSLMADPSVFLWLPWAISFGVSLAVAGAGAWLWHRYLTLQVDFLIEYCHGLALGDLQVISDQPAQAPELGRLGLAIQVMRNVLVDYLSLYRRFFEAAPDMFLALSPAGGRILDANQAFCQAVGKLRYEVLGQPVENFVTLTKGWQAALQGEEGLHRGHIKRETYTIDIEASISWEKGPQGQPWVLGATLRDVTQHEELLRELLAKSTALEKALEEIKSVEDLKDQFLTTLSHELKTPLVSIKGFLQLIMLGKAGPEDTRRYLDICWRNLGKLENQINNLLDLARLSNRKDQYEMGPIDLVSLVRNEIENLRPMAQEKKLRIEDLLPDGVIVKGNVEKLTQLVDNLLMNAIKYNKESGLVRVSVEKDDNKVTLAVTDSGVGMDREQMANIFNKFYRAQVYGTGRIEGLGIGLSLVQEIVRMHGGEVSVDSTPGEGTTFTVALERQA